MKAKLCSVDRGADNISAVSEAAKTEESGGFFKGRKHGSLDHSKSIESKVLEVESKFMKVLSVTHRGCNKFKDDFGVILFHTSLICLCPN